MTLTEEGLPLYLGLSQDNLLTVHGNDHYLDGRRIEIWENDIVLVGENKKGYSVNIMARLPSYQWARWAYNGMCTAPTLEEAADYLSEITRLSTPSPGDWVGYILHFDRNVHHARHYLGCTNDLTNRLKIHKTGVSPLIATLLRRGGSFTVADIRNFNSDKHAAFSWESGMKKTHKNTPKICPLCREENGL